MRETTSPTLIIKPKVITGRMSQINKDPKPATVVKVV